jgi:hypothetical protein
VQNARPGVRTLLLSLGTLAAAGCLVEPTAPPDAPYLAVVVLVDAPPQVVETGPYTFRIRELSGTLRFDTTFVATSRDTTILAVPPATYVVEINDVPASCGIREGNVRYIEVPPRTNTTLARFLLNCRNAITLSVLTDGNLADTGYVYTLVGTNREISAGTLAANDTVFLDGLNPGEYIASLRHVADNCTVLSSGGEVARLTILATGGASHAFRVSCAEPSRRPRIVSMKGSFTPGGSGAVGFVLRVVDPDRDLERLTWDVTDCNRRSVLPRGARPRGGFSGWDNVSYRDTSIIIAGFEVPLPDSTLARSCHAISVGDERGNVSAVLEIPMTPRQQPRSPAAWRFNAQYVGTSALRVHLEVIDPNEDYIGAFVYYSVRDGIALRPPDGELDRVIFQPAGVLGMTLPDLPFEIGFGAWNDYLNVVVFLVDREGNVTRLEDGDLFQ